MVGFEPNRHSGLCNGHADYEGMGADMEIGNRIKMHRVQLGMSQDQLAASVYCSRQTISSWENGKTYPDIQSLLLLSEQFGVTLDELIKGDVEVMQERIDGDVKAIWRAGILMWIGFLLTFATSVWFAMQIGPWGWETSHTIPTLVLAVSFWTLSLVGAIRADRIKKDHALVTFAEISAYMDGRPVDRANTASIRSRSLRERPWDKAIRSALFVVLLLVIGALIGYTIAALAALIA